MENKTEAHLVVPSIEGLYDEKAEAVLYSINNRVMCFNHAWVNASLHWESTKKTDGSYFCIDFQSEKSRFNSPEWGFGYGGIRFCKKCKFISCIHLWEKEETYTYTVKHDKYHHTEYVVTQCRICSRRILQYFNTPAL
mgnify:CR=1 FL=1